MSYSANENDLKSATFAIVLALLDLALVVFLTLVVISHLLVGHTTVLFVLFIIFPLLTFFALMIIFARELIAGDDMTTYGSFDDERTDYDYLQDGPFEDGTVRPLGIVEEHCTTVYKVQEAFSAVDLPVQNIYRDAIINTLYN